MLLANQAVAKKIYDSFPDIALLRRHPSPKQDVLKEAVSFIFKIKNERFR